MAKSQINADQLRRLGLLAMEMSGELEEDLLTAVAIAAAEAQTRAKIIGPKFTGEYAGGIFTQGPQIDQTISGVRIFDAVFSTTPHGLIVEEGRRAGARRPPLAPIARWVQLQVSRGRFDVAWTGKQGEEAILVAAAFVAQAIQRRGIPPQQTLERAALAAEPTLAREVDAVAARWVDRFEGAP